MLVFYFVYILDQLHTNSDQDQEHYMKCDEQPFLPGSYQNEQPLQDFHYRVYLGSSLGLQVPVLVGKCALTSPSRRDPQATESFPH